MTTATLTSKGQGTIPARIRASLGPGAGDRIESVQSERGKFAIKPSNHPVQALKGMIRKPTKPVSIDDINATIAAQGAAAVSGER